MKGVRSSFLIHKVEELFREYPAARVRFGTLRDEAAPKADLDPETLSDWMTLNDALGESSRTFTWFEQQTPAVRAAPKFASLFEERVVPALISAGRWADAGQVYQDPVASLRRDVPDAHAKAAFFLARTFAGDLAGGMVRGRAARIIRALHAAGREDEVTKIVAEAKKLDDSPEMNASLSRAQKG